MNIQRKIAVVFITSLLAAIIAGVFIFITITQTRESISKLAFISAIRTEIFNRANLLDEYLLYRTERSNTQWILTGERIDELLREAKKIFKTPDESVVLISIEEHNEVIKQTGAQLFSNFRAQPETTISGEVETRLVSKLLIHRSEMIQWATRLGAIVRGEITVAQQRLAIGVGLVTTLLFIIILINLTWIRAILRKLEEARIKDEALLESIGDGVIAIDAEGKIILMNQAAQTMLGWHPEEMTGKLLFDAVSIEDDNGNLIPREKRPIYLALAGTTTTTTTTTTGPTYNYVRKDKTKFPVAIKITPIVVDNKIIGAIDVFRDITKEKEIDRAKSDFISVASHQLRTPMTSIKWVIERFLKVEHPTQKGKEYLDDIHMAITNLSSLVDLLLNVSRIEAGKIGAIPKPLELVEFIKIYLKEQEPLVEKKRLRVIFDQHPATFNVITDHITLRNIVHSLVSNALEYTPDGGEIEIRIAKKDNKFLLTIRDTGIGIPKEEQGHSFEKFFRGSNAKLIKTDGTGLGLYIAAQAAKLLQGKIWMESVIGKGSTFSVELPIESKSVTGEQSMS